MQNTPVEILMDCFAGMTGEPVPNAEKEIWSGLCSVKTIPARRCLLQQDDMAKECYYIVKGLCRQYYIDDTGADITRGFISEGGFCCTEALFEADRSRYAIETLEECQMIVFRPRDVEAKLKDSIYMHRVYISALVLNIRNRIRRENMFTTCAATERYQQFMAAFPELRGRIKQVHLATYLGINQVTLSRVRRAIRESGAAE